MGWLQQNLAQDLLRIRVLGTGKMSELVKSRPGAIILAGGKSSRMGTNKALLRLTPTGPCLIEMVLAVVEPLAGSIIVSTNRPAEYQWLNLPLVADNYTGGLGPLAGLEAGLSASPAYYNLLIACDMPFLQPDLLHYLLQQAEGLEALVPLNPTGQPEPLCAVYSQACLPVIRAGLAQGRLKMAEWLPQVHHRFVPASELARFDPTLRSFDNLNSPHDLSRPIE